MNEYAKICILEKVVYLATDFKTQLIKIIKLFAVACYVNHRKSYLPFEYYCWKTC